MHKLLRLEEVGQFILAILLFSSLPYSWWVFPLFILLPDISMAGYIHNTQTGSRIYNFFHHKGLGVLIYGIGIWMGQPVLLLAGIIIFGHAAMDRIFGYGLKFPDDFKNTHLGRIGN